MKRKLNFLRLSLFCHYLAGLCIVRWPDQGRHTMQNLLLNVRYNFGFKIQPVDRIFFLQVERTFLVRRVHQKLAFLTHFIEGAIKNARITTRITKFTYFRVNLIFQPSLASGKPPIELKKANTSITLGKFRVYCNLIFFPKITSRSKTGRTRRRPDQGPHTTVSISPRRVRI